jgi:aryl-alcohol dehydrogenase-like predicted oxidoreductase
MTQKKVNPSEHDLLASAWDAIKTELITVSVDTYREQGWKSFYDLKSEADLPLSTMNNRLNKLIEEGKMEKIQVSVVGNSGVRRALNFYRPTIIQRLTKK